MIQLLQQRLTNETYQGEMEKSWGKNQKKKWEPTVLWALVEPQQVNNEDKRQVHTPDVDCVCLLYWSL